MATISEVRLWSDVGYMEGDVEIPKIGASLPTPSLTIDGPFNPAKGRIFSQIQIPENWHNLQNMSYIGITLIVNNGTETQIYKYIYGWIDSVVMLSDNADSPMCEINWHVDYWRTYAASMTFKGGLVKRAPSSSFPQTQAMTLWTVSDDSVCSFEHSLIDFPYSNATDRISIPLYFLYISYITSTSTVSAIKPIVVPLYSNWISSTTVSYHYISVNDQAVALTMSIQDLMDSKWEERINLDPSKIKGAWILPIPPNALTGNGSQNDPFKMEGWAGVKNGSAYFQLDNSSFYDPFGQFEASPLNGAQTTDTTKYIITGFDGETVGELPWGKYVSTLYYRVVISGNSCYMQIRTNKNAHVEGTCFTIAAPVVDTVENAVSTYNYSGQREYDMEMRQLGVYQQLAGSTQSAIGGAIAGGVSGAGPAGIAAGAGLGLGSSVLSAGLSQYLWNPAIQEAQDTLVSKQSSGLLVSGSNYIDVIFKGRTPRLVKMIADSASINRRSSVLGRYGYSLNVAYDSCQSLINSGGPLQISNLSIRGNAPTEAKQYVKALFERGVKLV